METFHPLLRTDLVDNRYTGHHVRISIALLSNSESLFLLFPLNLNCSSTGRLLVFKVSDEISFSSSVECLAALDRRFNPKHVLLGKHEISKMGDLGTGTHLIRTANGHDTDPMATHRPHHLMDSMVVSAKLFKNVTMMTWRKMVTAMIPINMKCL